MAKPRPLGTVRLPIILSSSYDLEVGISPSTNTDGGSSGRGIGLSYGSSFGSGQGSN